MARYISGEGFELIRHSGKVQPEHWAGTSARRSARPYHFRLYVSSAGRSAQPAASAKRALSTLLGASAYTLETFDVRQDPVQAEADKVLATPTLIRMAPQPQRRMIGELADPESVAAALGLESPEDRR